MRIQEVGIVGFKRFTNLRICDLPASAKLVVMLGPNGCGKSSVFDAFRVWQLQQAQEGWNYDEIYYVKKGDAKVRDPELHAGIRFHGVARMAYQPIAKKMFYIRSAYRHEPDFTINRLERSGAILESPKVARLIDHDPSVSQNYQRLVSQTVRGIYSGEHDQKSVRDLREHVIGRIRQSMREVFEDLMLSGTGDPMQGGAFFYEKGASKDFHYKNLSAGERAAFDILSDLLIKREAYTDSVFCIDEPEMHMHTKLQGALLKQLIGLVPENSQIWIATHSIGMIRAAKELYEKAPSEVAFLDFSGHDFDSSVVLTPKEVNRDFWAKMFSVALDDLANLIAPKQVVLCEGKAGTGERKARADFDAYCYRTIFASELPDTDFVSVGNSSDVESDRLQIGKAIQTLVSGTKVIRLIDRDDRSAKEVGDAVNNGLRVLTRRNLEAYLLDDKILASLCLIHSQSEKAAEILARKATCLAESVGRGNAPDDLKSAAGCIYNAVMDVLGLRGKGCGNNSDAFLRDTLAPLIKPGTATYHQLKSDIFGP
jgi:predicted ATPase